MSLGSDSPRPGQALPLTQTFRHYCARHGWVVGMGGMVIPTCASQSSKGDHVWASDTWRSALVCSIPTRYHPVMRKGQPLKFRSLQLVGTRHEREHQRLGATVPAEVARLHDLDGHRVSRLHLATEQSATKMPQLPEPSRGLPSTPCCTSDVNPPGNSRVRYGVPRTLSPGTGTTVNLLLGGASREG